MASPVLLFMIVALLGSTKATGCKSSTVGREFIFGILDMIDNCCHGSDNIISLDITNVSPNDTRVRLLIPYFNNDTYFKIPSGEKKTFTISPNIQRDGTFKDSRGVIITSESEISVLVTNAFNSPNAIDAYNILPVTEIGHNYTISSYFGRNGNRGSVILVAAVKDNTQVVFHRGSDVLNTVNLKAFEIYQYLCDQCDLTGVLVLSNNNVYVVSGSTYTNVPASNGYQQYIASEMLPTLFWSKNYIIPPVLPKTAFMIRILSVSSADVIISNITRTYRLSASSVEQYFGTETVLVTSEHPFSVTQYGVNFEYDYVPGDPFMTVVPSVDQYISSYTFTVPHGYYGVKHYTAIVVPKSSMHGLVLDGVSIQSYNATSVMVPAPFDNYTILTLPVKEGYHNFYHQHSLTFGVFMYGHGYDRTNEGLSYGFYAGFSLRGDCSTSTTSTTSLTVTSTSTSQTTSTTTSSPTATIESSSPLPRGLTCYSCDDLSDINLCDTVKQCNKHEICSVARYLEGGQTKYKSGCLQENTCEIKRNDSRHSDALCFECCHGDYCNNKGCGENGIPDRDRRGPICFDCQHVSSPEQCVKISPCESHQMCHIEEYKWFDHSHFKLGCGHGLCYPVRRMGSHVGSHVFKRETPVCHSCCSEEYCNRNCTTSSQGQTGSVIVG